MNLKKTIFLTLFSILYLSEMTCQTSVLYSNNTLNTLNKLNLSNGVDSVLDEYQNIIRSIEIDYTQQKVYWTDGGIGALNRSDFDGENKERILNTLNSISGMALDQNNEKIYYAIDEEGTIKKCNYDGTDIQDLITGTGDVPTIEFDDLTIYWLEEENKVIKKANLDGTGIEVIYETTNDIVDFDLDRINDQIYIADESEDKIIRIDYSGLNLTEIVDSVGIIGSLAISIDAGIIAWINYIDNSMISTNIIGEERSFLLLGDIDFLGTLEIYTEETVSVGNPKFIESRVLLSPNPTTGFVNISINNGIEHELIELTIYNIEGDLKERVGIHSNDEFFDCSNLVPGMYFFHFRNDKKGINEVKKIIVKE